MVLRDRLVLVLPAGHPLAARGADAQPLPFAEAAELDFVSLPRQTSLAQRLAAESAAIGRRLRVRIHVRSFDAICQMVAAGLGVAVLPQAATSSPVPWPPWPCRPWPTTSSPAGRSP
ncbi:MAG: hypothetical protein RIQ60_4142 [Pseudomonadota bacterium]